MEIMKFTNRKATNPGRVKLTDENGIVKTYTMVLDDGATEQGTPLTAETFNRFAADVMDGIANCIVGPKGDREKKATAVKGVQWVRTRARGKRFNFIFKRRRKYYAHTHFFYRYSLLP